MAKLQLRLMHVADGLGFVGRGLGAQTAKQNWHPSNNQTTSVIHALWLLVLSSAGRLGAAAVDRLRSIANGCNPQRPQIR
jgi:hypothetical protein